MRGETPIGSRKSSILHSERVPQPQRRVERESVLPFATTSGDAEPREEEHHREVSFQHEFRKLLQKYQIEFDERSLWD
jgi:hypothetical protein